ncbi:UBX domain-containing protein 7 [Melanomma pulvis-pyrius CBS 109.77]|uniref:UBX domain-containing protein 7 n=1 Tax=Melanomma pulvis-pyrius CBS 109.77 TaxID=1314802 RepID=A0A6A6XAC2_9PLEO|nr:UBX domain-containing protein 7 [Melanomma pulvis-pyrius CBS 109.77]
MDDEDVLNFVAITSCDPQKAAQYLGLTDNNLEQAIQLYFDSPNLEFGVTSAAPQASTHTSSTAHNPIEIDSDEDMSDAGIDTQGNTPPTHHGTVEDDAAMARRLQEEMYGGGPETDVRAPMQRTTETLVGPGANWGPQDSEADIDALVQEQMARRRLPGRPGIFNQRTTQTSVWDSAGADSSARRRELATATGGASESSNKSNMLAELYRPPFELMFQQSWDKARDEGKEQEKWIIVNIQDPAIFDCQILNRDIWKNNDIKLTVRENFIFMQYAKDDPRGQQYINYYFHARDSQDAYPHIAIVDPRTGEQVKVWSGPPVPNPVEFHAQLHEFLDRYSLKANAKNPVATRKPERKKVDVDRMTEEEMLEMALQNSLDNNKGPKDDDPDALTKVTSAGGKGKAKAEEETVEATESATNGSVDSPFAQISTSNPHTEPAPGDAKVVARIQFRGPSGRPIVRRFNLADPVRRLYEWIKAENPWEGKQGEDFDLVCMGKNLLESLDSTIGEARLGGASVMVEFI